MSNATVSNATSPVAQNQKAVWFDCPFCGTEVKARVWSLCGHGKRCMCEAMFYSGGEAYKLVPADEARNTGVNFPPPTRGAWQ
jgi:hypothetical protein